MPMWIVYRRTPEIVMAEHESTDIAGTGPPTESATMMITRLTPDGVMIYASPGCEKLFGWKPGELVGQSAYDFFHPDELPQQQRAHERVLETVGTIAVRYRFRCADGDYVLVATTARHVVEDGELIEIHAATRRLDEEREDEEARRRWEACFSLTTRGIAVVDPGSGLIESVNRSFAAMHGGSEDDFIGRPLASMFPEAERSRLPTLSRRAERDGFVAYEAEHTRLDGSTFPVATEVMAPRDADGTIRYRIGWFEDLTVRRRAEINRALAERDFKGVFDEAPIGMALVSPSGQWLRVNRPMCEMVGYSERELLELTFQDITHPADLDKDLSLVQRLLDGSLERYEMEKRYFTKPGTQIWVKLSVSLVRDEGGEPLHFISHVENVTDRKLMEARLHDLAARDPLTSLWNRRRFEEELTDQLARCKRYDEHAALMTIDLDRFKEVNDRYGHATGDALLRSIATNLDERMRASDTLARVGGDEFNALLIHADAFQAERLAEELRRRIATTTERAAGEDVSVTASIGIVLLDGAATTESDALVASDHAMYMAKRSGGNRASQLAGLAGNSAPPGRDRR